MSQSQVTAIEELVEMVSSMDRHAIVAQLQQAEARFPVDFTPEFLSSLDLDRLRHIYLALCIQCRRTPADPAQAA
jgi:hypothetical protein